MFDALDMLILQQSRCERFIYSELFLCLKGTEHYAAGVAKF